MANGIPALLDQAADTLNVVSLLTSDATILAQLFSPPVWGIYQDGSLVIKPDSILALEFRRDWRVSDYPQEEGAFQSYNKVTLPYGVRVVMTKGGTVVERQAFLAAVDQMAQSLDLFTVMTPDAIYADLNIEHEGYRRTATSGQTLITVELWFLQIRIAASATFYNTKQPSGASPVQVGQVQPLTPSQAQVLAIAGVT